MFVLCQPMSGNNLKKYNIVDLTLIQGIGFLFQDFKKPNVLGRGFYLTIFSPEPG